VTLVRGDENRAQTPRPDVVCVGDNPERGLREIPLIAGLAGRWSLTPKSGADMEEQKRCWKSRERSLRYTHDVIFA
jgi:hypothetical protein